MPSDNDDQLLELWNRARALSVAALHFGPPEALAAYEAATDKNFQIKDDPTAELPKDADWLEVVAAFGKSMKPLADMYVDASGALQALRDHLVMRISNGTLWAIGYGTPRHHSDLPVRIPNDVWSGKISWDKNEVTGNGLHFVAVRVAFPPQLKSETLPPPPPAPKLGRPTLKPDIFEAFQALLQGGNIDLDAPLARLHQPIRDWLSLKYPDRRGQFSAMADETIRKVISPEINRLKSSQKQ